MGKIRSALKRITRRLLGRTRSPESASGTSTAGEGPNACPNTPLPTGLTEQSHRQYFEPTSSITTQRAEADARRHGPDVGMVGPGGHHVTAHYSIGCQSGRSCNPSGPVWVKVTDTNDKTFRYRPMTCVEDAIVWLVVALDLPDGQAHDLADLGRCWYDGRLFEIKEVKP
jgi:hypothetical protein